MPLEGGDEVAAIDAPFTGSLINEFKLASGCIITEEQRLSAVISDMTEKCILIPRGRVLQTALNAVLKNPMWVGYPIQTYRKVSNLRHWRLREGEMSMLDRTFSNPAIDFLEPLTDLSEWAFDFSGENDELRLRSLRWPGFTFYVCDSVFANYYFGHGIAQTDVAAALTQKIDPSIAHKVLE
jgi:hypothetical protein